MRISLLLRIWTADHWQNVFFCKGSLIKPARWVSVAAHSIGIKSRPVPRRAVVLTGGAALPEPLGSVRNYLQHECGWLC
jgi:hypothetical protein